MRKNTYPNNLQWYSELLVVLNDILKHAPVLISPSALMEAETPVGLHCWHTDDIQILAGDLRLGWAREKVEVDVPADRPPSDVVRAHEDLLAMRISKVNAMRAGGIGASRLSLVRCQKKAILVEIAGFKIEWMTPIDVLINGIANVCSVDGSCEVVPKSKTMDN
jgi:hypothetical protein